MVRSFIGSFVSGMGNRASSRIGPGFQSEKQILCPPARTLIISRYIDFGQSARQPRFRFLASLTISILITANAELAHKRTCVREQTGTFKSIAAFIRSMPAHARRNKISDQANLASWKDRPWTNKALDAALSRSNAPSAKARSCGSARTKRRRDRNRSDRLLDLTSPWASRPAARKGHRDLRSGIVRQDHLDLACHRRSPKESGVCAFIDASMRSTRLCAKARIISRPPDLAADTGDRPGNYRYAGALGRVDVGHRLGRGSNSRAEIEGEMGDAQPAFRRVS